MLCEGTIKFRKTKKKLKNFPARIEANDLFDG